MRNGFNYTSPGLFNNTFETTIVEVNKKAPNKLPIAISTPSLLFPPSRIELKMSGAPFEKAIKLRAAMLGESLRLLDIEEITVDKY